MMRCDVCLRVIRHPSLETKFQKKCGRCRAKIPDQFRRKTFPQIND